MKWNIIRGAAPALSSAFVNESFDFNGKFLSGTKVLRPRWKRVLAVINGNLGELLGQLYVEEVFPPQAKDRAKAIVGVLTRQAADHDLSRSRGVVRRRAEPAVPAQHRGGNPRRLEPGGRRQERCG